MKNPAAVLSALAITLALSFALPLTVRRIMNSSYVRIDPLPPQHRTIATIKPYPRTYAIVRDNVLVFETLPCRNETCFKKEFPLYGAAQNRGSNIRRRNLREAWAPISVNLYQLLVDDACFYPSHDPQKCREYLDERANLNKY